MGCCWLQGYFLSSGGNPPRAGKHVSTEPKLNLLHPKRITDINVAIQINYLSTALLALLLLPSLKSSLSNPEAPVMTFVTTFGLYPASPFMGAPRSGSYLKHLSNNKDGMMQANQYGRSKGLLLYFTRELASRVSKGKASAVTVNSADPGAAWTPLTDPNRAMLIPRLIMAMSARDVDSGAKVMVNAVGSSEDSHGGILLDYDLWP